MESVFIFVTNTRTPIYITSQMQGCKAAPSIMYSFCIYLFTVVCVVLQPQLSFSSLYCLQRMMNIFFCNIVKLFPIVKRSNFLEQQWVVNEIEPGSVET